MRVLILLALIAGLGWYGWSTYGTAAGAAPAEGDGVVSDGYGADGYGADGYGADLGVTEGDGAGEAAGTRELNVVPVVRRPERPEPSNAGARDAQVAGEAPTIVTPPAVTPRPDPQDRPEAAGSGAAAPRGGDERAGGAPARDELTLGLGARRDELARQGRLMLHDLEGVQRLLGEDSGLSEGRRQLLFALASLVIGQEDAARAALDQLGDARDVTSEELAFLRAYTGPSARPAPAGASVRANPLLLGTRLGIRQREADAARFAEQHRAAAEGYSELIREELRAPWAPEQDALERWAEHLDVAQAQHRWNRRGDWPSFEVTVRPGDSLTVIRKRIIAERKGFAICTGLIAAVNQTGEYLQPDQVLRIPTDEVRTEVYIGARWVLYLHGDEVLTAWPCTVGRPGHETPPGKYRAGVKQENPSWMRSGYDPVPFGDPENPLGTRWISWDGRVGYGYHGTWEPEAIGTAASDGCVRLRNEDVERLFEILPVGAEIDVRP